MTEATRDQTYQRLLHAAFLFHFALGSLNHIGQELIPNRNFARLRTPKVHGVQHAKMIKTFYFLNTILMQIPAKHSEGKCPVKTCLNISFRRPLVARIIACEWSSPFTGPRLPVCLLRPYAVPAP